MWREEPAGSGPGMGPTGGRWGLQRLSPKQFHMRSPTANFVRERLRGHACTGAARRHAAQPCAWAGHLAAADPGPQRGAAAGGDCACCGPACWALRLCGQTAMWAMWASNQQSAITYCQPNHGRTSGTQTPSATRSRNRKQLLKNTKQQAQSAKHKGAERPSSVQLKSQGNAARGAGQRPSPQSAASHQLPAQRKARPKQTGSPGQHRHQQTARPQASRQGTKPEEKQNKAQPQGGTTTLTPSPERTRKGCPA